MSAQPLGVGLVGAGAYGVFCLAAFAEAEEIRIAAICDTNAERAESAARAYNVPAYTRYEDMLADASVQIVALNTPPFLHAAQGIQALEAGKHLFCEKPLALSLAEGAALQAAAQRAGCKLTIDYVMRHNPLWKAAAALRSSGLLGRLLHMDLANHAAGLSLPADHWFWDHTMSGGIWIEHGVHFFDAFAWVAGTNGEIVCAQAFTNTRGQEDRVEALARYGDAAAHFYHGFTHSGHTEQTTVQLTFEQGHVTLREWVPVTMEIASVTRTQIDAIRPLLPGEPLISGMDGGLFRLKVRLGEEKSGVYRACIQSGIRDLARAIQHPEHALCVTVEQGLSSLSMAIEAQAAH